MEKNLVKSIKEAVDDLLKLFSIGRRKLWVDYDKEADVLYVNFDEPQKADNAREEKGVITRTRKGKIVGLTVLNASLFSSKNNLN